MDGQPTASSSDVAIMARMLLPRVKSKAPQGGIQFEPSEGSSVYGGISYESETGWSSGMVGLVSRLMELHGPIVRSFGSEKVAGAARSALVVCCSWPGTRKAQPSRHVVSLNGRSDSKTYLPTHWVGQTPARIPHEAVMQKIPSANVGGQRIISTDSKTQTSVGDGAGHMCSSGGGEGEGGWGEGGGGLGEGGGGLGDGDSSGCSGEGGGGSGSGDGGGAGRGGGLGDGSAGLMHASMH